jgi:hypothetical protein
VLLQLPNAGDDLQAIKKGVMELADLVVINKADLDEAAATAGAGADHQRAALFGLHGNPGCTTPLAPAGAAAQRAEGPPGWTPSGTRCSTFRARCSRANGRWRSAASSRTRPGCGNASCSPACASAFTRPRGRARRAAAA